MLSKTIGREITKTIAARYAMLTVLLASALLRGQTAPPAPNSSAGLEFPVIMRQNVAAGSTPVGTKVEAKLTVATLVSGVVVPEDAILSGEVTDSVAKSASGPSRLAIRMDSVRWKNGSTPKTLRFTKQVYLTAWFYPPLMPSPQDLSAGLPDAGSHPPVWNGGGAYPGQRNPTAPPSSGSDRTGPDRTGPDRSADTLPAPPASASNASQHRVPMKNVEPMRTNEGTVTLTSRRFNIKLDKTATYVFAEGSLAVGPS
jgi:hypothetical protein